MKITINGSFFGTDGYSSHTRQLANALGKLHDVKILTNLFQGWETQCNDFELDSIKKPDSKDRTFICIGMPQSWPLFFSERYKRFIGFLVWEGNKIPMFWMKYIIDERVDQVWVPSAHTYEAIINTARDYEKDPFCKTSIMDFIKSKVRIVPHGVEPSIFKPEPIKHDKFTFVCNKGWRGTDWDRGGVQYVLRAFAEEFKPDEPVRLLLKLNPAYMDPNIANQAIIRITGKNIAEIRINLDNQRRKDINKVYNESDIYVASQLADGFDLGSAEAMSSGLPVIVGGYGGQIEHVPDDCGFKLKYKLERVKEDPMYEEVSWGKPDLEDLKKRMRYAFEHQEEMKEMGKRAREFIVNNFTWDITANKATKFLEEEHGSK